MGGGFGIPQGLGNIFGSTAGAGGGGSSSGTVQSVRGPSGQLTEFNPATMTPDAPTPTPSPMGLPANVTNFLATPVAGVTTGITTGAQSAPGGAPATPAAAPIVDTRGGYGGPGTKIATPKAGSIGTPASGAAPTYTPIPMNAQGGYNTPGTQQSMAVSDQYNPWTGSSQQIASPGKGVYNAPSIMGTVFTDGKGGYYSKNPAGVMTPLTGQALTAAKGMFDPQGYGAQ